MLKSNFSNLYYEAGTDEAGRGCLAGPVTAAAIILPKSFKNELINDSKQLSEKNREILKPILEKEAVSYAVTHLEPKIIDEINILNASIKAMQESVLKLNPLPIHIIVDGNRFKPVANIPHTCIIKGDAKYMSIAAASILAKTYKDEYIQNIVEEYPDYKKYDLLNNSGYGTVNHLEAIRIFGITPHHRKTFGICKKF